MWKLPHRTTYAGYLAIERDSPTKHEFINGQIVAMAGASVEHNALAVRFGALVDRRLSGSCLGYSSDMRFWIESTGNARYPDVSIICGPPTISAHDKQAASNPVVIVEVLSPSSEQDDDGDKRLDWQSLPSLEAYVLIAQDARRVKVYRRERGEWSMQTYRDGDRFALPRLGSEIGLDEVYDRILEPDGRSRLRS